MPLAAWRRSASWRPSWLGLYSSSRAATITRSRVSGRTPLELRMTRETVAMETSAWRATSRMVCRVMGESFPGGSWVRSRERG